MRRGSASSSRRISLSGKAAALPPVDRDGPRLVSGEPVSGEAKPNTLASLQEEEEEEEEEKKDRSGRAKDRGKLQVQRTQVRFDLHFIKSCQVPRLNITERGRAGSGIGRARSRTGAQVSARPPLTHL